MKRQEARAEQLQPKASADADVKRSFEIWVGVREQRTRSGDLYIEYRNAIPCESRGEAERTARWIGRTERVLVHDLATGEVRDPMTPDPDFGGAEGENP